MEMIAQNCSLLGLSKGSWLATSIYTIKDKDGKVVEGFDQVRKVMLSFYKNLVAKQFTPTSNID